MEEKSIQSRGILAAVIPSADMAEACERNLDELSRLFDTAGGETVARVIQIKHPLDPRTLIGRGKVAEIEKLAEAHDADTLIFDTELSPSQIRNLEEDTGVRVIDRSMLVLDIFALRATSGEGKLQVELAQLRYTAPRLIGQGTKLSRQGGGIGSRGPGESKLETDKRHIKERIVALERAIAEMAENRNTMRRKRDRSGLPKVAIVGYTNAGKSTLLNYLTGAGVLSEDKLFATLDPTTRRMTLPSGTDILLTDTVGFIRKLPHHLVDAFKSTLDEVRYADILLVLADATSPDVADEIRVTTEVIADLGAKDTPVLLVYNKCDALSAPLVTPNPDTACISAATGAGVDDMLSKLEHILHVAKCTVTLRFPYEKQGDVNTLYGAYEIVSSEYRDEGVYIRVRLDKKGYNRYRMYMVGDAEHE